jgi:glycosyltransferase involved in cell wall biosynthesis
MRPELEDLARRLGIADRVSFAGTVTSALPDHYRASDALVMPSEIEAFGLVQIEAMASAIPVIVSAVPGARTVSTPGLHGWHVRPADVRDTADAVRALARTSPEERAAMGRRGRERVLARYTWRHSVDALERSLIRAVGTRRSVRSGVPERGERL